MPHNYNEMVPDDSFIGHYLAYMRNQETASAYDMWSALWLISVACGRNIIINRPRAPVYMNMYVVLVGDSGVARKSSVIRVSEKLARGLLDRTNNHMKLYTSKMTGEKLDEVLHNLSMETGKAQVAIAISELAVFMGTEQYIANMPTLLTDLYDCPDIRRSPGTIVRGAVEQRNVYLTFITASTPVWLLKTVNPNVVEGGFTSRAIFVQSNQPKRKIAWPEQIENEAGTFEKLIDMLSNIRERASTTHTIELNEAALRTFSVWYESRMPSQDLYTSSFEAREDAHVLRAAAMLAMNDGSWLIHFEHIRDAIHLITEAKKGGGRLFEGATERSRYLSALESIRNMLINAGMDPVPRAHAYLRVRKWVDMYEFGALVDVLHEMGAIQRFELQSKTRGPATNYIRGTKLLLSNKTTEKINTHFLN